MIRRPPRSPLFPNTPLSRSLKRNGEDLTAAAPRVAPPARDIGDLFAIGGPRKCPGLPCQMCYLAHGSSTCRNHTYLAAIPVDRKSTRLNSSHSQISYAVFCL